MSLKVEGKWWGRSGQSIAELGERRAEAMEDKNKENVEYDQMQKENWGVCRGWWVFSVPREEQFCCYYPSDALWYPVHGSSQSPGMTKGPCSGGLRCWWNALWTLWGFFGFFLFLPSFFFFLVGFCFLPQNKPGPSHADPACAGQGPFWTIWHTVPIQKNLLAASQGAPAVLHLGTDRASLFHEDNSDYNWQWGNSWMEVAALLCCVSQSLICCCPAVT